MGNWQEWIGEAFRILSITQISIICGMGSGIVRAYFRMSRITRSPADRSYLRHLALFHAGSQVILISVAWRQIEIFHDPLHPPLVLIVFGQAMVLVGMFGLRREMRRRSNVVRVGGSLSTITTHTARHSKDS